MLQLLLEFVRGLVTIRAYGSAPAFVTKYDDLVNKHSKVFLTSLTIGNICNNIDNIKPGNSMGTIMNNICDVCQYTRASM